VLSRDGLSTIHGFYFCRHMTDRDRQLADAASEIDTQTLQAAKAAVAASCREYIRWAELFSCRLESVPSAELHKFARAFALTLLGHLPTRPATCPFCIQYGHDKSCRGCGYAATHGRCDEDDSAFSLFIEAFQELGRVIYQDTGEMGCPADEARQQLYSRILASANSARKMEQALASAGTQDLMELKAGYIRSMVEHIPVQLLSEEVAVRAQEVKRTLGDYW
jgi:hypothetical protein